MTWFHSLDVGIFRFINGALSNPVFDKLMPFASGNAFFVPAVLIIAAALLWKGGKRGRIFVFLVLLVIALGDGWICNSMKQAIGRARPFVEMPDAHLLVGKGKSNSLPSSHAANWFAATMTAFIFYRRSWRFMLPLAFLVSFSRIYVGVHYPSDVLAGAILGAGYAVAFIWFANALWQFVGRRWFPFWWENLPSLINPDSRIRPKDADIRRAPSDFDSHWLRLGYIVVFALLAFRLVYIASGTIELSEDEAYQWVWSKHLALSYYSKPLLIAVTQFCGTAIFGDTELGVRFFSPVLAAVLSVLLLRFFSRESNVRAGVALMLILSTAPLTAVGSILMTIDPLSVLFWTTAMLSGWRAVQNEGGTRDWIWSGVWMGLGFLSKYTNLFQLLSWLVFFLLWPAARKHLRKPGPYLALLVVAISLTPVLIWNAQHGWITVEHVANNGGLGKAWKPTLRYTADFLLSEMGLLNPVYFIAMLFAGFAMWRAARKDPLRIFLFSMGAPLFLFYFALSFKSRIFPNWIAPSVVPLFCLMAIYFYDRWKTDRATLRPLLAIGLVLGTFVVVVLHDTDLTGKWFKRTLPAQIDPLRRVRAWEKTVNVVWQAREKLAGEGKPTFIIGDHYGITGALSFYLPEAKKRIQDEPLVYYRTASHPKNQFYFWPGYETRKGENAIYVQQIDLPKLESNWFWKWLSGEKNLSVSPPPKGEKPPQELREQFNSIVDLGITEISYRKRVFRRVQIFECRDLR
jgi:4-amino-4-deoxy-L-arabinose transferase-like glycosyltransferase